MTYLRARKMVALCEVTLYPKYTHYGIMYTSSTCMYIWMQNFVYVFICVTWRAIPSRYMYMYLDTCGCAVCWCATLACFSQAHICFFTCLLGTIPLMWHAIFFNGDSKTVKLECLSVYSQWFTAFGRDICVVIGELFSPRVWHFETVLIFRSSAKSGAAMADLAATALMPLLRRKLKFVNLPAVQSSYVLYVRWSSWLLISLSATSFHNKVLNNEYVCNDALNGLLWQKHVLEMYAQVPVAWSSWGCVGTVISQNDLSSANFADIRHLTKWCRCNSYGAVAIGSKARTY